MDAESQYEWKRGWVLVLAAMLGYGTSLVYVYTLGMFITPIQQEMGWSRGAISSGPIVCSVLLVCFGSFAGRLVDRHGCRRLALIGLFVYGVGIALLSTVRGSIVTWWLAWAVIAVGFISCNSAIWATAVAKNFSRQRGLALALVMCGSGVTAFLSPIIAGRLIEAFGWRHAYLILGSGIGIIIVPILLMSFYDGGRGASKNAVPAAAVDFISLKPLFCSARFMKLAAIAFVMTGANMGTHVHFASMLGALAVDPTMISLLTGMLGIGAIAGRLLTGFLLDRLPARLVGAAMFLLPAIASATLLGGTHNASTSAWIAAPLFGAALGAEFDFLAYVTARLFDVRSFGTIYTALIIISNITASLGPTAAGAIFDLTGSYNPWLQLAILGFLASAALAGSISQRTDEQNKQTTEHAMT